MPGEFLPEWMLAWATWSLFVFLAFFNGRDFLVFFNGRDYVHSIHSRGWLGTSVHTSQLEKIWQTIHACQKPPESLEHILSIGLNAGIEDPRTAAQKGSKKDKKKPSSENLEHLNLLTLSLF